MTKPMFELQSSFSHLPVPVQLPGGTPAFSGARIGATPHHVTKDTLGRPGLLIAVGPHAHVPPIALRNLRIEHGLNCRISIDEEERINGRYSVIQCHSLSSSLQECFLILADALLQSISGQPTAHELSVAMERMTALFRTAERASTRTAQALWGELFLIYISREPSALVQAWHIDPAERFDFSDAMNHIEVKTASDRVRNHHFSLAQLCQMPGATIIIASLFVEASSGGLTLGELWDEVRTRVSSSPELRLRVDEVCLFSLGAQWEDSRQIAFDQELAASSLSFFRAVDIPCIERNVPAGVTEVRFR